ncbi:methyltransferase domain-containing protein [Pseudonocardia sp. MH-G8]|uniref:methyltransferase domain-containing protein n=1 Tax=Pseudonocardia sp. MH-G8 TaxID=1854588 RepID=UPI001E300986|nr:methyltransferase domain-containing protein [Pseudonocardia sp. MH-G8]
MLDDPAWRAAVESVPRHVFVPRFYVQQPDGEWSETAADSDAWLDAVYEDVPLVTALAETDNGARVTVSSSTKPALMLRMLRALQVRAGHRVLEIGSGTGYNAALLAHRFGDENVFTVDIGAALVDTARERLAELGYTPTLAVGDGRNGLPEHAPYDRVIATCSVPTVPWAWAEQVRHGGLVLVDVKRGAHAGNLVLLRREEDRLEGRFLPKWAGFMAIRDHDAAPPSKSSVGRVHPEDGERTSTPLDPAPWSAPVPWLLASAGLPRHLGFGHLGFTGDGPEWAVFTGDDGSWCAIRMQPDGHGEREVRQGGPVAIWGEFETVHGEWEALGRPGWDRLGLTVTADGQHRVWLDEPDGAHGWSLPT